MAQFGKTRWLWAILAMAIAVPAFGTSPAPAHAATTQRLFPETGKTVQGKFLDYWNNHGGLAQQGYPISNQMQEKSETDGKTYTVQYFERAVFELHPEYAPPNDVLLELLGVFLYGQRYPTGAPGQQPNNSPGSQSFPQTGKRIGGKFLAYWQSHGALTQQGYPVSDEFMEKSVLDGKTYRVQYFERAVFELHPENAGTPYEVLLSQVGKFSYNSVHGSVSGGTGTGSGNTGGYTGPPKGSGTSAVTLVNAAKTDINSFWQKMFSDNGVQYTPPRQVVAYTRQISTACGPAVLENSFYCPPDHSIYYDSNFLQAEARQFGDFAPQVIMAHEWGHLVQRELGLLTDGYFSVEIELQADCFAGVWTRHASDTGFISEDNLDEGASTLFSVGNTGVPWFAPEAHGTPDQRQSSFLDGYVGGVDSCVK